MEQKSIGDYCKLCSKAETKRWSFADSISHSHRSDFPLGFPFCSVCSCEIGDISVVTLRNLSGTHDVTTSRKCLLSQTTAPASYYHESKRGPSSDSAGLCAHTHSAGLCAPISSAGLCAHIYSAGLCTRTHCTYYLCTHCTNRYIYSRRSSLFHSDVSMTAAASLFRSR